MSVILQLARKFRCCVEAAVFVCFGSLTGVSPMGPEERRHSDRLLPEAAACLALDLLISVIRLQGLLSFSCQGIFNCVSERLSVIREKIMRGKISSISPILLLP